MDNESNICQQAAGLTPTSASLIAWTWVALRVSPNNFHVLCIYLPHPAQRALLMVTIYSTSIDTYRRSLSAAVMALLIECVVKTIYFSLSLSLSLSLCSSISRSLALSPIHFSPFHRANRPERLQRWGAAAACKHFCNRATCGLEQVECKIRKLCNGVYQNGIASGQPLVALLCTCAALSSKHCTATSGARTVAACVRACTRVFVFACVCEREGSACLPSKVYI